MVMTVTSAAVCPGVKGSAANGVMDGGAWAETLLLLVVLANRRADTACAPPIIYDRLMRSFAFQRGRSTRNLIIRQRVRPFSPPARAPVRLFLRIKFNITLFLIFLLFFLAFLFCSLFGFVSSFTIFILGCLFFSLFFGGVFIRT